MKRMGLMLALAMIVAGMFAVTTAWAAHVSPPIVFVESNDRTATVTINNRGKIPKIFRFSWEHRVMTPDGRIKKIKEPAELASYPDYKPVEDYLRFSPRQTILQPNQYQKINFLVRRPADLPAGEYHSHFLIEEEPILESKVKQVEGGVGGQLSVRVNKSIPIFLRHGQTQVSIDIEDAKIIKKDGKDALYIKLKNNSTRSVYAPVVLNCTTADGGSLSRGLKQLRIYQEGRMLEDTVELETFPVGQCQSLSVDLMTWRDFEYNDKVIASRKIR